MVTCIGTACNSRAVSSFRWGLGSQRVLCRHRTLRRQRVALPAKERNQIRWSALAPWSKLLLVSRVRRLGPVNHLVSLLILTAWVRVPKRKRYVLGWFPGSWALLVNLALVTHRQTELV